MGVKQDAYWFNDGNNDSSWDAVWEVVVARNAEGWQAEFRIPFSQLRFSGKGDGQLGFAITRDVARLNETSTWPLLSKSASGWVSSFGTLTGVNIGSASKRLELVPYTVAQVVTEPVQPGNPLQKTPDPGASVGADLKYAVTPALTLNATVNPDFGQVEADPAVVNLSAFETFFEEKRPFFIEGSGNYQFQCRDCNMFYTRRIGRQPRGYPTLEAGGYASVPRNSTILGAAKLTGRVREFSVGVLAAVTQEEQARVAFGDERWSEVVEPMTFYSVSRARREFSDQSSLGFILTTTNRQARRIGVVPPESAVTGGIDYDWRIGQALGPERELGRRSNVSGSAEAISLLQHSNVHSFQRPDAEHVELDPLATSLSGHSGNLEFNKIAGEKTRMNVNIGYLSPGFDMNDVGFQRRADPIPQNSWFQFRWNTPGQVQAQRATSTSTSGRGTTSTAIGCRLGGNVNSHWTFQNQLSTGGGINFNAGNFDDRLTRGGPGGYVRGNVNGWQYFNTDDRRLVSARLELQLRLTTGGAVTGSASSPGVSLRPTAAFSAEFGVSYEAGTRRCAVGRRGDRLDGRRITCSAASIRRRARSPTRVNYTVTPNAVGPAVCAAVRVGRRSMRASRSWSNGRADRLRRPLRAVRLRRQRRTSTCCRSAPPTSCAGNTSPARRCSSSGSRGAKVSVSANGFPIARTSATSSRLPRPTPSSSSSPIGSTRKSSAVVGSAFRRTVALYSGASDVGTPNDHGARCLRPRRAGLWHVGVP